MMKSHNETMKEIKRLEKELVKLKEEKSDFESMSRAEQLAWDLHGKFCHHNHTDGCGWYYSKTSDFSQGDKEYYLKKAIGLLDVVNGDLSLARKILDVL